MADPPSTTTTVTGPTTSGSVTGTHMAVGAGSGGAVAALTTVIQHFQGVDTGVASSEATLALMVFGGLMGWLAGYFKSKGTEVTTTTVEAPVPVPGA